ITGLNDVALAGEVFQVTETERAARAIAERRALDDKRRVEQPVRRITLADLATAVAGDGLKSLNLVLKAEANGSLEALRGQVQKIDDPTVKIRIVGEGVGPIGESDVNLAGVSDAIVIGFNVKPDDRARAAAETQGVDVRHYDVVYQVTEDIERAVKGLYEPRMIEVFLGRAEVRRIFTVDGKNAIAGSHVIDGKITRNATCRVLRDTREIAKSRIADLKRFKDDVREVARGYDCGITLSDFNDFAEGDLIEAYSVEQQNA
ncbi:MAG: translation initiation factor IF-2, partial [Candidatus Dormibacteraeota bacterium]|nr:translation initiation factor IF-2 [Candidatus Dormibacteraeota bacterium]